MDEKVIIVKENKFQQLIERIDQISKLKDGWNGPNSIQAKRNTILTSKHLLKKLFDYSIIIYPFISMSGDGQINFIWTQQQFKICIGIYEDGKYSYYARSNRGRVNKTQDDLTLEDNIPEEIINLIKVK